jgi:broad specificity phosphatase PhoE
MIEIWLEFHAQTHHNAAGLASGHFDVALTEHGRNQARTVLRERYAGQAFDAVYVSDTQRALDTARLMFEDRSLPIFRDPRLRECDYGELEGRPRSEMEAARLGAIHTPFPRGESYLDAVARMASFLADLSAAHERATIMIVGHAAQLYSLDHLLRGRSLEEAIVAQSERPYRYQLAPDRFLPQRSNAGVESPPASGVS